ncbi:MAG: mechanosensitive channel MscK [Planctomycetaceae bacterium]
MLKKYLNHFLLWLPALFAINFPSDVHHTARAQEKNGLPNVSLAKEPPQPTLEEARRRLEELKKETTLKADVKARIESHYTQAINFLQNAAKFEARRQELESLQKSAPELERQAQRTLDQTAAKQELNPFLDLQDLEDLLKQVQAQKDAADKEFQYWEARQKYRDERKPVVAQRLAKLPTELAKTKADLEGAPPSGEPVEAIPALRFMQRAQLHSLKSEQALLELESTAYKATDELVTLKMRAAKHQSHLAEERINKLQQEIEEHRENEVRRQITQAKQNIENLKNAELPAPLIEIAKKNLELARIRTGENGSVTQLHRVIRELRSAEALLKKIEDDYKETKEKLQIEGIESEIGPLLVIKRRELPNIGRYSRRIAQRNTELSRIRLKYLDIQQQSNQLVSPEAEAKKIVQQLVDSSEKAKRSQVDAAALNILQHRKAIQESLLKDYRNLLERLAQLTARERQLIETTQEFRVLIDKHILWVRTAPPFGLSHLDDARESLLALFQINDWQQTAVILGNAMLNNPLGFAGVILLLALAIYKSPEMKKRLAVIDKKSSQGFLQPFSFTIQSFLLTAFLSAIWPAIIGFVGWSLQEYSETTAFAEAVGWSMQFVASLLFTFDFLRRMFRSHGLAESHFRWKDARLRVLRRHLQWFVPASLPGVFFFSMINTLAIDRYAVSLGRLLLVILLLLTAAFLAIVLRNRNLKLPFSEVLGLEHTPAAKPASLWQLVVYFAIVAFPIVLAVAALAGYQYSAKLLTWKLLCTAWLTIALLIFHAMGVRWLFHARGKLALEQVQATKGSPDSEAGETPSDSSHSRDLAKPSAENVVTPASGTESAEAAAMRIPTNLATINTQTRRMLQILVGIFAVWGLWSIWSDVVPALKFLEVQLWTHQVETIREATDGKPSERITTIEPFTLGDLLFAIAILGVVFVAGGNLPGLLEIGLLKKLPLDAGARYAATSLVRYTIYVVGIVTAFNLVGIGWEKIQWLVAALSVGLGFGLQEIVANFVSGVILLFEQPLRVGDVVTIGDVSGVVTRIQIRATTIQNWDKKEYIVPNKELVTGKLMNWTLSDSTTRIVINVGVAYGTDANRVRTILQSVVDSHPLVLKDPPPLVVMEAFGDSSLNFAIRCYLSEITQRLETTHQLHAEIQRKFKEADIEIPFPQRDLHIRSDVRQEKS